MSLSLPLMNNLCKRWTLPEHIKKDCDFYFLRSYSDAEFVQELKVFPDGTGLYIQEYGTNFTVIFQHGADKVYTRNGELAKKGEPCNNTSYWCSFRSITFLWQGVACTKSYVLVQVDKSSYGIAERTRGSAVGAPRGDCEIKESLKQYKEGMQHLIGQQYLITVPVRQGKSYAKVQSFAERSQPRDKDETPEIDEEV